MLTFLKNVSLRIRISLVYIVIVGTGGIITSFVGSTIVTSTIFNQARSKVHHDMNSARIVYQQYLSTLKQVTALAFFDKEVSPKLTKRNLQKLSQYLEKIRKEYQLDFLALTDWQGKVIYRVPNSTTFGDNVAWIGPVRAALNGISASSTEIIPQHALKNEDPSLVERAQIKILPTEKSEPTTKKEETSGMVLIGAAPVRFASINQTGALYGGILLNNNFDIVDRTWELLYKGEKFQNLDVGTVTIFLHDLRIATTVRDNNDQRAIGTRVSEEVSEAVLKRGERWTNRAFIVNNWYITDYEPIKNYEGQIIGILCVGQLEKTYIAIRNKVIYAFFLIASICFFVIIFISYFITRSITRPLSEMVEVANSIATGDLDHAIKVDSKDEIGQLAHSFNRMLASLKKMRKELEEWGNTLEQKVKKRTEELAAMQKTLMQSQRLASLGKLAAGIAHEINNPLGGILVLSSLVLEDLDENDPHRENLEEVIKQTMRCRDIVKGLLQFSRQEEGKTEYVNVNEVLSNTLSLIEKQALFHNIKVIKKFQKNLPSILGDASQLQQVFMNIILNAVQAMKEVGTLTLTTYHDKKNDLVVIDISDTGCGISPEHIDRIFDPFFTTKEVGEGTGLGLAIAYGIVTKHQGRMSVKSKVGEGTTFTVKFPVAEQVRKIENSDE